MYSIQRINHHRYNIFHVLIACESQRQRLATRSLLISAATSRTALIPSFAASWNCRAPQGQCWAEGVGRLGRGYLCARLSKLNSCGEVMASLHKAPYRYTQSQHLFPQLASTQQHQPSQQHPAASSSTRQAALGGPGMWLVQHVNKSLSIL